MAIKTITLPITKSGYVRELEPTIVFPTEAEGEYKVSRDFVGTVAYKNGLCFGFEALPDRLKYARIYSIAITLSIKQNTDAAISVGTDPIEDFDPETLTYANRKQIITSHAPYFGGMTQSFRDVTSIFSDLVSVEDQSRISVTFLRNLAFIIQNATQDKTVVITAKPELTDSSTPYITVSYDDAVSVSDSLSITKPIGTSHPWWFNATAPQTVEWELLRDSADQYYCYAETFEQASAVFYWRKQGETNWNQIPVSGSEKRLVIPKNTFATDPETPYEYYVSVTDVLGNVLTSGIATCVAAVNLIHPLYGNNLSPHRYYYNPHKPISFFWEVYNMTGDGTDSESMKVIGTPGDVTIEWKVGTDGESHYFNIPVFGASSYDVPAETFPAVELIGYRITGTDSTGYPCTANSVWLYFKTAAGPITSTAIAPINSVEKNNQEILFLWQFSSDDGNPASRFELLWRTYGAASWNTLHASSDIVTQFAAEAGTFPVGQIEWAIVPYNLDNIAGNYSVNSFIAYGAPEAPLVSATAVPFTTISWQSDGQQAFEVDIDGTVYGVYFGDDKEFSPPAYLDDGEHTIRVRVAGTYYLWSDWSSTTVVIANESPYGVYLSGEASVDASLSWETDAETGDFYVYRDGEFIARTDAYTFADRLANGEHSYQVLNRLPDGNYCISQEITVGTIGYGTFISAADQPGSWLEIKYSTEQERVLQIEASSVSAFYHYSGDKFPHGFTNGYLNTQITFSAAFKLDQEEEIRVFESMLGTPVIIKHDADPVIVGTMTAWTKSASRWAWVSYVINVQQIEWEDFADERS